MRDQQDRALEGVECLLECLACLDVEMVGRLVEHQQVGASRDHPRQQQSSSLTTREDLNLLLDLRARKEEAAEQRAAIGRTKLVAGAHRLEHGGVRRKVIGVLREVRDFDVVAELDCAAGGISFADQRLDQRRLAGTVWSDHRHPAPALQHEATVLEEDAVTGRRLEVFDLYHDAAGLGRLGKTELHRDVATRHLDALDLGQLLAERLGLFGARAGTKAADKAFEALDLLLLLIEGVEGLRLFEDALLAVRRILHVVDLGAATAEFDNAG